MTTEERDAAEPGDIMSFACPGCGERRQDWLEIGEAESNEQTEVTCLACGTRFSLEV